MARPAKSATPQTSQYLVRRGRRASALVPAELYQDPTLNRGPLALYCMIRGLSAERSTYREKSDLAGALGWSVATLGRAAKRLEDSGWLQRTVETLKSGGSTSTWEIADDERDKFEPGDCKSERSGPVTDSAKVRGPTTAQKCAALLTPPTSPLHSLGDGLAPAPVLTAGSPEEESIEPGQAIPIEALPDWATDTPTEEPPELRVVCHHCGALEGVACQTRSGSPCEPHKARRDLGAGTTPKEALCPPGAFERWREEFGLRGTHASSVAGHYYRMAVDQQWTEDEIRERTRRYLEAYAALDWTPPHAAQLFRRGDLTDQDLEALEANTPRHRRGGDDPSWAVGGGLGR